MTTDRVQWRIERLLDQVEEAIDQLDWEEVRSRAQVVLRLDPDNSDALSYLAAAERDTTTSPTTQAGSAPRLDLTPQDATQPTSFANGRYQVKRFLGEGGKKKVYLAHDTLLDQDVAFAPIKSKGFDGDGRARFLYQFSFCCPYCASAGSVNHALPIQK